jgi:hypothetical protein
LSEKVLCAFFFLILLCFAAFLIHFFVPLVLFVRRNRSVQKKLVHENFEQKNVRNCLQNKKEKETKKRLKKREEQQSKLHRLLARAACCDCILASCCRLCVAAWAAGRSDGFV